MMHRPSTAGLVTVVLGLVSIAAGPPVALRVELEPTGSVAGGTTMAVTIQVAPEDRSRLGRDVWVQGELLHRGERVDRLARALDVNEAGQARFEAAWPPGDYELRIELQGAQREVGGFWVGPITVPSRPDAGAVAPLPAGAGSAAAAAGAAAKPEPEPATSPAAARPEPGPEVVRSEAEPVPAAAPAAPAPEPEVLPPEAEPPPVVALPAAEPEPSRRAAPPAPEPAVEPAPEVVPPEAEPPPVVALPAAEPEPGRRAAPPAPAPSAAPSRVPAALAEWSTRTSAAGDVTVVVTERNRPILGLGPSSFELRVGGADVPVEAVGDASSAPLNLGLVIHVSGESEELAGEIVRQLGGLALRASSGGNLCVVTPADPDPTWGATADDVARAVGGAGGSPSSLAALVTAATDAFAGRRGRSFLLVVTDGHDDSDKSVWKSAVDAAEGAGVPVHVVGLRDADFAGRARSSLARIAEVTGGRSYFLGDAGVVGMTLDYLGELIEASYALPYGAAGTPSPGGREVKVAVTSRDWEVAHPRRVP